jgi:hypothetical protein
MEVRTKKEVCDVQRGDNGDALITFDEEPGITKPLHAIRNFTKRSGIKFCQSKLKEKNV